LRAFWNSQPSPPAQPYLTGAIVAPPPCGGDDAPAWAACLSQLTHRAGHFVVLPDAAGYNLKSDPWAAPMPAARR